MSHRWKWFRDFFAFSRTESRGFVVLAILLLVLVFSPFFYKKLVRMEKRINLEAEEHILDSLVQALEKRKLEISKADNEAIPGRFRFDPNDATDEELQELGLPVWLTERISNYREAGGEFRVKSDLKRIYGFPDDLYKELEPWIILPITITKADKVGSDTSNVPDTSKTSIAVKKEKSVSSFDINEADTLMLIKLYEVGPVLSKRIVDYRTLLGGFVRKEQFEEVFGLSDTVLYQLKQYAFISDDFEPRKISINKAGREELQRHPYISPSLARAIVNYRKQHGYYKSVVDLLKIHTIDDARFYYIKSYVSL